LPGRVPEKRLRQGRLPLETARLVLAARRASDGLRRLTTRQGLHLESAKKRVGRLQQSVQTMERNVREKELALNGALAASTAIETRWRVFLETVPDALII